MEKSSQAGNPAQAGRVARLQEGGVAKVCVKGMKWELRRKGQEWMVGEFPI